jgi:hypothetical protein
MYYLYCMHLHTCAVSKVRTVLFIEAVVRFRFDIDDGPEACMSCFCNALCTC